VFDIGAEGLHDPTGLNLPPCIVMDRGESLQDCLDHGPLDRPLILSVRFMCLMRMCADTVFEQS
jgi:hypothetical protein